MFSATISFSWSQDYKNMIEKGTFKVQDVQSAAEKHFETVGKGKGYKQFKCWEYNALRNSDSDGYLKPDSYYLDELERVNQERNNNITTARATTQGTWEEMGPTYWNATSGTNPGVGRVTSVAIESSNSNHVIIGAASGGVWRTTDAGVNWTVLTDNISSLNVTTWAINPTDNTNYFWGSTGGVIYSSEDSGATWNVLSTITNGTSVNKIIIDSTNDSKMYASVSGTGVFKSTDSGVIWVKINDASVSGYDVEFKPGDSSVIYATGDGFYVSTDGGQTFVTDPDPLDVFTQEFVSSNVKWKSSLRNHNNSVSPKIGNNLGYFYSGNYNNDETRLVLPAFNFSVVTNPKLKFSYTNATWDGDTDELKVIYKTSLNGTWQTLAAYTSSHTSWVDVILDLPNQSSDYYVAFLAKSKYGFGITLDDVSVYGSVGNLFETGFESTSVFGSGAKLVGISPDNSNIVYVLEAQGVVFGGFYKSTDSGASFTKLNHGTKNYFGYSSYGTDNLGQAPRDMAIAVNPSDVSEVHIGGINTWRSVNGGTNFSVTSQWRPNSASSLNIGYCHADIDIMEYVDGKLYVGTDGGLYVADNPQTLNSNYYRDLSTGLGIRQFYKIGVSQTSPEIVVGGSQDNGLSAFDNSGTWKDWFGGDGMEAFVDKNDPNILYGAWQNGSLVKSLDQWNSVTAIGTPDGKAGNWVTPFEQDDSAFNAIYTTYDKVYKSTNGGSSWSSVSQVFYPVASGANPINADYLKIAPSNSDVMLASLRNLLFKTDDGGATNWVELNGFDVFVTSIAIHPTNPNKIAIGSNGDQKVYISNDGGTTWTSYLKNLPDFNALALVWQNNGDNGLYVGMNYGVYYIDDTLTDWQLFSNNLPNVQINELEINTSNNKLYAGTYGRGVWKSDLYDAAGLFLEDNNYFSNMLISLNPASSFVNLKWDNKDDVTLKLYNSLGKLMHYHKSVKLDTYHKLDVSKFSPGIYFLSVNNKNAQITKKIIID